MILKTKSYTTSDKRAFFSITEAKTHELGLRLANSQADITPALNSAIELMVKDPDTFIAILRLREPQKRGPKVKKTQTAPAKSAKAA